MSRNDLCKNRMRRPVFAKEKTQYPNNNIVSITRFVDTIYYYYQY